MSKPLSIAAACTVLALAGAASAQPYGARRPPTATLYELPNFQGRSITVEGESRNLSGSGFNDRARSGRFDGDWRLCGDADFRGPCQTVRGQVRDLAAVGLDSRVSSARAEGWDPYGPGYGGPSFPGPGPGQGPRPGTGYGAGPWGGNRGAEGRNVVFYAYPRMDENDLWGTGKATADDFCRRMGHRYAVYFDVTERSRRSQDFGGRFFNDATVLRDVLCRK